MSATAGLSKALDRHDWDVWQSTIHSCHIFYYVVEFLDRKLADFLYFDTCRAIKNMDRYCAAIAA